MKVSHIIYFLLLTPLFFVSACKQKEDAPFPEVDLSNVKSIFVASGSDIFEISDPNGSVNVIKRYSGNTFVKLIRLDAVQGKIYWSDADGTLKRMNMNGANEEILANIQNLSSFVLDIQNNFAYCVDGSNKLYRIDLSNPGLPVEFQVAGNPSLRAIDLDEINARLYYCNTTAGRIMTTDLTGNNAVTTSISAQALHIVLDEVKGKVYWFDTNADRFMYAPSDGSVPATVSFGISFAEYFSVDPASNRVFYGLGDFIVRNTDGTGPVKILTNFNFIINGNALLFH